MITQSQLRGGVALDALMLNPDDGGLSGNSDFARVLLEGGSIESFRQYDDTGRTSLRRDEWVHFDSAVVAAVEKELRIFNDMVSAGLSYNLPNPLGTFAIEWEEVSKFGMAQVDMDLKTRGETSDIFFQKRSMPLPLVHAASSLNLRQLRAARLGGTPLDTVHIEMQSRAVAEKLEDIAIFGTEIMGYEQARIYGLFDGPAEAEISAMTYSNPSSGQSKDWDDPTKEGPEFVSDVLNWLEQLRFNRRTGPFVMYVSNSVMFNLSRDYSAGYPKTILQRLREIPELPEIRALELLGDGANMIIVKFDRDVVDLVRGIDPVIIQWVEPDNFTWHFRIIAMAFPRFRNQIPGRAGILKVLSRQ